MAPLDRFDDPPPGSTADPDAWRRAVAEVQRAAVTAGESGRRPVHPVLPEVRPGVTVWWMVRPSAPAWPLGIDVDPAGTGQTAPGRVPARREVSRRTVATAIGLGAAGGVTADLAFFGGQVVGVGIVGGIVVGIGALLAGDLRYRGYRTPSTPVRNRRLRLAEPAVREPAAGHDQLRRILHAHGVAHRLTVGSDPEPDAAFARDALHRLLWVAAAPGATPTRAGAPGDGSDAHRLEDLARAADALAADLDELERRTARGPLGIEPADDDADDDPRTTDGGDAEQDGAIAFAEHTRANLRRALDEAG
ncbi:MAG: hypothetical protein M0P31_15035 [Solirubrobacteraceae bacterium]|nr:hypothetical protein [Solirubrobacteraceae bacterium]